MGSCFRVEGFGASGVGLRLFKTHQSRLSEVLPVPPPRFLEVRKQVQLWVWGSQVPELWGFLKIGDPKIVP